jgi:hypothetical protein
MARKRPPGRQPEPAPAAQDRPISVLPLQLRVGDVVLAPDGEWEVVEHPVGIAGRHVVVRIQAPGRPETEKEGRWEAYQRVKVRRPATG